MVYPAGREGKGPSLRTSRVSSALVWVSHSLTFHNVDDATAPRITTCILPSHQHCSGCIPFHHVINGTILLLMLRAGLGPFQTGGRAQDFRGSCDMMVEDLTHDEVLHLHTKEKGSPRARRKPNSHGVYFHYGGSLLILHANFDIIC